MRSNNLVTSPVGFMFWDKDLQKFATEAEVRDFCKVENDLYGSNEELRLQCLGRFIKLSDTGMVDKDSSRIYEGFILQVTCECMGEEYKFRGVVGFEKAGFALFDGHGGSAILSAFDSDELKIIGNIYQHPELIKEKLWQKKNRKLNAEIDREPSTTLLSRLKLRLKRCLR